MAPLLSSSVIPVLCPTFSPAFTVRYAQISYSATNKPGDVREPPVHSVAPRLAVGLWMGLFTHSFHPSDLFRCARRPHHQGLADWTTCTGALSYSPAPSEPARGVNGSRLLLGVFPRCARVTGPGALPDSTSAPAKASIASATDSLRLRPPLYRTAHAGLTVSVCIPTVAAGERGALRRIRRGRASVERFPAA